jgi:hypothetical protein
LTILERRGDGHHVVAFDPSERDAEPSGRRAQRRSPRGREEPRVTRGRRVLREGEEDLDEVVRTSRRRAVKTAGLADGEGDKIQIEVGAVKGLESKRGVKRGAFWIVALSLLLFWIPVLGPAVAGYVGGRKAGTPLRALFAAVIPIMGAFAALAAVAASTSTVPALVRHFVEAGYSGVLGSLPFDFPILAYMLGNLAAVMRAGPDSLFLLLAFALAGGAMSEMRIQERSVPPITARVPASRVARPMVQSPGRATSGASASEVDGLVVQLNDALARAEKERRAFERARAGAPAAGGWGRSRLGLFSRGAGRAPSVTLQADEGELPSPGLGAAGRKVIEQALSSTPPGRGERRARAAKAPDVDLGLPKGIAYAAPGHALSAEGRGAAHQYRSGKYYHIYGGSVNPVARAKLEKRLRRTHTLHSMRRGARSFAQMVEVDPAGAHRAAAPEVFPSDRPRSLESGALQVEMHYDALEHLENASFHAASRATLKPAAHPAHPVHAEDDLGGLIAKLGEGGEAVVDESAVRGVEFGGGPVFDRRGRQRARIAPDEEAAEAPPTPVRPAAKPKAAAPAPLIVREAIEAVSHDTRTAAAPAPAHVKVARSADRATLSPSQDAKVNRWLKKTIESAAVEAPRPKAKAAAAAPPEAPHAAPAEEPEPTEAAAAKAAAKHAKPKHAAPAFEITHGSTEVDDEAEAGDDDAPAPRKHRSAADILREIKAQRKADKDAEEGEETARAARKAKEEADAIETHAREQAAAPAAAETALAAEEAPPKGAPPAAPRRRRHGDDLEEVKTDAERLDAGLELTLAPVRDEPIEIREIGEVHAEAAPLPQAEPEGIPQVGADEPRLEVTEIAAAPAAPGAAAAAAEPERDVQPGEVVLAGPSTDAALADPGEAELSPRDQEKIRKRLQEGWNRL